MSPHKRPNIKELITPTPAASVGVAMPKTIDPITAIIRNATGHIFKKSIIGDKIVPYIDIDLPKSGITKNQLLMLDIIANNENDLNLSLYSPRSCLERK